MSPIEERVTALLGELAEARPVQMGTPPAVVEVAVPGASDRRRPDYVPLEAPGAPVRRPRRRPVLVAAAVVLVLAAVVGLLAIGGGGGRSPVVASRSDLPIDTALLGDGRMAVVLENQLHVADGPTGQVWKLTDTGRGEEVSNVSFSHDGEWVAFTIHDESGLWVSRWDGSERHRIGRAPSTYAWSPTDDQLAYATQDEVRIAQTDGSSRALVGGPPPQPDTSVAWSPDGQSLAMLQQAFPGEVGGLVMATLEGAEDPGWGKPSLYSVEATEVVGWPSEGVVLLVGASGDASTRMLEAALLSSVETAELVEVPSFDPVPVSASAGGDLTASVPFGAPAVDVCDLAQMECTRIGIGAGSGPWTPSVPSFSPNGSSVALVGSDLDGRVVLTVVASDGSSDPGGALAKGIVLTEPPAVLPSHGVTTEPAQWIDDGHLLVRAGDAVELIEITSSGGAVVRPVVEGQRFLAPVDDYPGGTELAYWSQR